MVKKQSGGQVLAGILTNRIKSLLWRALGMTIVAGGAYILGVGDIWQLDFKLLANTAALAFLGLIVGEITKFINIDSKQL